MKTMGRFFAMPMEMFKVKETIQPILSDRVVASLQSSWEETLGKGPVSIAFSLGTPNHYQKITALVFDRRSKPFAFAKVGCTPQASRLIANERMALEKIRSMGCHRLAAIPELLGYGETGPTIWMLQTALLAGRSSSTCLEKEHIVFLAKVAGTRQVMPLQLSDIWAYLQKVLNASILPIKPRFKTERLFISSLRDQLWTLCACSGNEPWPLTIAHGDFAPWNMRLVAGNVALFDWEYFLSLAPVGWDIIYFIFQVETLIKKQSLESVWAKFEKDVYRESLKLFEKKAGLKIPDVRLLALLVMFAIALDLVPKWICGENDA